jgi:hypothetical protein
MHQTFPLILRLISEASKRGAPMNKNELTEYADLLIQAAVRKCDNLADTTSEGVSAFYPFRRLSINK